MRRPARLSFLLGRAPTLRLSTVFVEQAPLPAAERRRAAAAEAVPVYETSEGESEWEEDDGLWEDEEGEREQPANGDQEGADEEPEDEQAEEPAPAEDPAADPTADPAAAADSEDSTHDEPVAADSEAHGAAHEADGCCEVAAEGPAVLQQVEEEDESSNTAAQDGGEEAEAEGAENVPPPADEPQPRYDAITHSMLKHLLLLQAEASCTLSGLQETADCAQDSMADLRAEMEARFAAIEKSLFFIMYALGAKVPPHTRRRLGYNSKAGRAASAALTAAAMVDDRLALKAASAAASRAGGRR
ncbi:hypothetical protein C2E21_2396 [Chlorella sorokiniana]|uniref:Uncharacterized protein n=1 Tax=Chlorella sorokiniana TaxID=3076 RepID=A0A2P6TZE0_CHLSO|nr:hypothetical protein C2E21_2396 [Chlorella sorokiniana]|eukprot:PRW59435.1 hypothetical protein C2E21_2396 [Chlorella sorokiniana]